MSGSGDIVRGEVYTLLGISNTANPLVPLDTARQAINRQGAFVAKKLGLGPAWVRPAFATTLTDLDYTLPSGVEYEQVLRLVYANDGRQLVKIGDDVIALLRSGSVGSRGRQYAYSMDRSPAGLVTVAFGLLPSKVENVDAYVSTMPVPWPAGSATPPTIPFSTTALRVLELLTAEDIGRTLGDDKMTALGLSPKSFDSWHGIAMALLHEEILTVIRLKRSHGVYNYQWFQSWGGC